MRYPETRSLVCNPSWARSGPIFPDINNGFISGSPRHPNYQLSAQRFYLSRWPHLQDNEVENVDFPRFVYLRQHRCPNQKNAMNMVSATAGRTCQAFRTAQTKWRNAWNTMATRLARSVPPWGSPRQVLAEKRGPVRISASCNGMTKVRGPTGAAHPISVPSQRPITDHGSVGPWAWTKDGPNDMAHGGPSFRIGRRYRMGP